MSAMVFLAQPDAVHLMTDAAVYDPNGVIQFFEDKTDVIREAGCAINTMGGLPWGAMFEVNIRSEFDSYDAVFAGIERLARDLWENCRHEVSWRDKKAQLFVIGYSHAKQRPEGFTVAVCSEADAEGKQLTPFKPDLLVVDMLPNPLPSGEELFLADYRAPDVSACDAETELLNFMLIQRTFKFDSLPGGPYCVGGWASLTSATADGITQKRVHEWPEDRVGELIRPKPLNVAAWRAERDARRLLPPDISRSKADDIVKKARRAAIEESNRRASFVARRAA